MEVEGESFPDEEMGVIEKTGCKRGNAELDEEVIGSKNEEGV